jgi:tripartite ATP-independent transporter DctM subunit
VIELVTEYFLAIALFFSFITLIFYGFPVAWTMGGLGVIFIIISMLSDSLFDTFYGVDWGFASMVVYRLYGVMANWVLVALPMFIFMGIMMDKSGIAEDLMTDLSKLFGKTRGGLAISIVFIGVLLAASTGIIGAAVVLLTILGVPLMLKNNYNPDLACGVVCATGTLGILIPPSIMLVIMGDQVRISVGDLFMGAVFPGLLLGLLYTIYIFVYAYLKPKAAPLPKDAEPVNIKIIFRVLKSIIPPALLIFAVLGSIFMGIATSNRSIRSWSFGSIIASNHKRKIIFF